MGSCILLFVLITNFTTLYIGLINLHLTERFILDVPPKSSFGYESKKGWMFIWFIIYTIVVCTKWWLLMSPSIVRLFVWAFLFDLPSWTDLVTVRFSKVFLWSRPLSFSLLVCGHRGFMNGASGCCMSRSVSFLPLLTMSLFAISTYYIWGAKTLKCLDILV